MAHKEFTLPSGAKFFVTMAPFEDACVLRDAVIKEVRGQGITIPQRALEKDIESWKEDTELMSIFLDKIMAVAASREVKDAIFRCFERCKYNEVKVSKDLFNDPKLEEQAREDYYPMCMRVMEVNLKPFFKKVSSLLGAPLRTATASQG